MTTAHLWQRFLAQATDETFAPLFEAEKNLVWTICARFLDAPEDTDEAFQSAWMRVIVEARAGRVAADNAHEHLCRIAGREADALRKRVRRRRQRDTPMEPSHESIPSSTHAQLPIFEGERRAVIEALVAQLPDKLRLPVQLHYLNGMTQREVAATLGVPPSTIDSRLKTALDKLRPLAERAGMRDLLSLLMTGGLSAGLLTAPTTIKASVLFGAANSSAVSAAGLLGTATSKFVAIAAIVMTAVAIGVFWPTSSPEPIAGGTQQTDQTDVAVDGRMVAADVASKTASAPSDESTDVGSPQPPSPAVASVVQSSDEMVSVPEAGDAMTAPLDDTVDSIAVPARFMSVIVIDKATGQPVADASTRVVVDRDVREKVTDVNGVATYDDIPTGLVRVVAHAHNLAQTGIELLVASDDPVVTFELTPAATLHGTVFLPTGEPARDIHVIVRNSWHTMMTAKTDERGQFEVNHVARGIPLEQVSLHPPQEYEQWAIKNRLVIPPDSVRHDIKATLVARSLPVRRLTGWVMDARTGQPVPKAILRSNHNDDSPTLGITSESGEYTFEIDPGAIQAMIVEARGYAPKYLLTSVLEDDPNRIELTRGLVASGIIVDENGQSVSDAVLTPVYGGNRHWKGRVRPGTDGSFQLQDLDQDTIVELNVPGSQRTQRLTDLAGKTNQQVVLESFIPATGRVTASDTGNPIRQFRIRIGNPAPATPALQKPAVLPRGSWDQGYIIDSEDGTFELGEFRRGDVVSLIISADGYATCEIDPYLVAKESVPIELSRATDSMRTWRGSVRAEDGSPVPDARLTLVVHRKGESEIPHRVGDEYFVRRMRMHNVVLEGSSSADGSFDLGSMILPHGGTLVAESDHHIGELLRLDDDSPDPVEITLRTGTRLRIQYDRTLFRNAEYVEFRRTDGSASFEMPLPPEVDRFDIGSLEPGEYIVTLMTMGDRRGTRTRILRPSSRSVKLARGQQALVTFTETDGFIVEGRVMDGESAWTEGAILYLQRRQPRFDDSPHLLDMYLATHETLVSADGSFSFTNVDAGTYQFRLHGIDGDFTDQGIGGGDPFEVTASMSGLIVQRH